MSCAAHSFVSSLQYLGLPVNAVLPYLATDERFLSISDHQHQPACTQRLLWTKASRNDARGLDIHPRHAASHSSKSDRDRQPVGSNQSMNPVARNRFLNESWRPFLEFSAPWWKVRCFATGHTVVDIREHGCRLSSGILVKLNRRRTDRSQYRLTITPT